MARIFIFLSIMSLAWSCKPRRMDSDVRITSTIGPAYVADLRVVDLIFDLWDFGGDAASFNEEFLTSDVGQAFLQNASMAMASLQMSFAAGQLRNSDQSSFAFQDIKILQTSLDHGTKVKVKYNAKVIYFDRSQQTGKSRTDLLLMRDISASSRRTFVDNHKECFTKDLAILVRADPGHYENGAFYYFAPDSPACLAETKAQYFVTTPFDLKLSPENPTSVKYPEYQKIWKDNKLSVSIFFTTNGKLANDDSGAGAYAEVARSIHAKYGKPQFGQIPEGILRGPLKSAKVLENPRLSFGYTLANQREFRINLSFHDGAEGFTEEFLAKIAEAAKTSDLLIYNGHAGYGMNIEALEKVLQPQPDQHLLMYINGCSSFNYVGRGIFRDPANAQGIQAGKDIDVISNLLPSYFQMFAAMNVALTNELVVGRSSYLEIFQKIQAPLPDEYNPILVVRGEEDNSFIP